MSEKKAGLASLSTGRTDIHRIDPRVIRIRDNWNCRDIEAQETKDHIEQLALSIAEIGVQEPITVYWDKETQAAWVTDGHCRLWACKLAIDRGADIKTIPVKSEDRYANDADRLFAQIIRNGGKQFTAMENAKVYKRLVDMGWQQSDIAKKAGVSAARISQVLDLLTMPEPIKKMVTNGSVSASLAVKTLAEHNPQKATQVLQDAVATAQSEGKAKAKPDHVARAASIPAAEKQERKLNQQKVIQDAFEYASIDEEQVHPENGNPVVLVSFRPEDFEKIRKAFEL